jgi:uncharacterized protein YfbU (UPF0304 family)
MDDPQYPTLSYFERLLLINQYRALALLAKNADDRASCAETIQALEEGYVEHYPARKGGQLYAEFRPEQSQEVREILSMYEAIQDAEKKLKDKSGINRAWTTFPGFGGNDEGEHLGYLRYLLGTSREPFKHIRRGKDLNSHMPSLDTYRRMLSAWEASDDKRALTRDDLLRILPPPASST